MSKAKRQMPEPSAAGNSAQAVAKADDDLLRCRLAAMQDPELLDFPADRGSGVRWVASVCTDSLVFGAAGLLKGYKATSQC